MTLPHLVVLRGNAASGKTTLAAELQRAMGPATANVGQDHLRRVVLREHEVAGGDNIGLIDQTVRHCLGLGYHVVLEGMLRSAHYGAMLGSLVADHAGPTHVLYLDVALDETLRRHATREMAAHVSPERLRGWYLDDDRLGLPGEVVLDGRRPLEETLAAVLELVGPLPVRPDADRFL